MHHGKAIVSCCKKKAALPPNYTVQQAVLQTGSVYCNVDGVLSLGRVGQLLDMQAAIVKAV